MDAQQDYFVKKQPMKAIDGPPPLLKLKTQKSHTKAECEKIFAKACDSFTMINTQNEINVKEEEDDIMGYEWFRKDFIKLFYYGPQIQ